MRSRAALRDDGEEDGEGACSRSKAASGSRRTAAGEGTVIVVEVVGRAGRWCRRRTGRHGRPGHGRRQAHRRWRRRRRRRYGHGRRRRRRHRDGTVGVGTDGTGRVGVVTVGRRARDRQVGTVTLTVGTGTAAFPSWASRCAAAKPPTATTRQNSLPNHFIRRRPPVRGVCNYNAWTLQRDAASIDRVLALLRRRGLRRRGAGSCEWSCPAWSCPAWSWSAWASAASDEPPENIDLILSISDIDGSLFEGERRS